MTTSPSRPDPVPCPRCGSPLPADAPEGLCPRCLGKIPLDTGTLAGETETAKPPAPTPEELAPLFPQLEILGLLGRGGMGVVYKARQKTLGRLVALKLLDPARTGDPAFASRFAGEARLLAGLAHPNIVTVFDSGETGGRHYLLMEFVDGVNLRHAMRAGRFTPEQALAIVPPVCDALQYAHDHGVVHRDIKPENILLDRDGRVKIADFGVAKLLRADGPDTGASDAETRAGTPGYAAPEQRAGAAADRRADIWSLGAVLYELLTGELPAAVPQPPSRKVRLDVRIDDIVLRALETSPELRYTTAVEMKTRVEELAGGKALHPGASRARRIIPFVVIGISALFALGVVSRLLTKIRVSQHPPEPAPKSFKSVPAKIADNSPAGTKIGSPAFVLEWLAKLDAGNYDECYRTTGPVFQKSITEATWKTTLNAIRRPLGKVVSRRLISEQTMPVSKGAEEIGLIALQYRSEFADVKGPMIETVLISCTGREAVRGYYIKPAPAEIKPEVKPASGDSR